MILETGTKIPKGSRLSYQSGSLVKLKVKNRLTRQFIIINSNFFVLNPDDNNFKYRIKSLPHEINQIELISGENVLINPEDDHFFFEGGVYDMFVILNENTEVEVFSFKAQQN